MGSLRKKSSTRALPVDAEIVTRKGKRIAQWVDGRGKKKTAEVRTGRNGDDRIAVKAGTYTAKFRDAQGVVREVATGCRDKQAAQAVLNDLERRAELVKANVMTAIEGAVADHQATALTGHLNDYIRSLRVAGKSKRHVSDTYRLAKRITAECGFRVLADFDPSRVESWLAARLEEDMAARTRNSYLQALKGFCTWCVANHRLVNNPISEVKRAKEKTDRRIQRRALTEEELRRLLYVARWRPLAEYGTRDCSKTS